MAITIRNLESSFRGAKNRTSAPAAADTVVITEASTKNRMKKGKILRRRKVLSPLPPAFFIFAVRQKASASVMGMMASVRVSFTMVAVSSVFAPGCMPSQAAAAAVTEDVSLTAVPANRPKPWFDRPSAMPRAGNTSAAITLNRKMTEIDCAISSSSASMTGAVAAMAEPPQMEEPTPTSVEILAGIFMALYRTKEMMSEVEMVKRIMGRDCAPTFTISERFRPNPSRITAYCRIFLEVEERNLTIRDFRNVAELGNLNVIKALAEAGQGIAFLYEPTVRRELQGGTLREIPLCGCEISHDFTFLWRKNSVFAEEYHVLFELLRP